jgi:hypothetical protein
VPRVGHVKHTQRGEKESDERMETKKLMATFAILMIALGIAGFAYAHWSEYLWLEGTVTTGNVCVEWSFNAVLPPSNLKDLDGDGEVDDPVATLNVTFVDEDQDGCKEGLIIELKNVYPSLWVNGTIDVTNCGTIPVGIAHYDYKIYDPDEVADGIWLYDVNFYLKDPTGGRHDITMPIEQWIVQVNQIDPGWSLVCEFFIHFGENTPEGATATIEAEIVFWNWNEL